MTAPIDVLLSKLDGVRERRAGQWMARCPAHDDKRPSLLIELGADDRVLLFDYAGCGAAEIVAAVGLSLGDLFARRLPDDPRYRRRRPFVTARDALAAVDHEMLLVAALASDLLAGRQPSPDDLQRLADARVRLARVREVVG